MRVLVTGGAGFIGSHLVEALAARGDQVVALDAFDDYYDPALKRRNAALLAAHPGVRLLEGDVRDAALLEEALDGVERVVHLAARPGVRASLEDPTRTFATNLDGTLRLLEALRLRGPKALVFASSSSVYGGDARPPFREDAPASRPLSPYAASKRAGELLCASYAESYGLGVTALRFFTVYGPRGRPDMAIDRFVRSALLGRPVPLHGDGSVVRDFTYVADVVRGVIAALDRTFPGGGCEVVNVGGGRTATMRDLIARIEAAAGRPLLLERRPPAPGDMPLTSADLTRAKALLGFESPTPLEEGLARTVAWVRQDLAGGAEAP